jgi:hypothetical protein
MVMPTSMQKIIIKKAAVGVVQAIQLRFIVFLLYPWQTAFFQCLCRFVFFFESISPKRN